MREFEIGINLASIPEGELSPEELAWDHAMDISGSIYSRLAELGMSKKEFAEALGVSAGRVSQIIKGDPGLTLRSLARIEAALSFRLDSGFRYAVSRVGIIDSIRIGEHETDHRLWPRKDRSAVKENKNFSSQVERRLSFEILKGGVAA